MAAKIIQFSDLKAQRTASKEEQQALSNISISQLAESMFRRFEESVTITESKIMEPEIVTKTETFLKNENCIIDLRSDKEISGQDLTDQNNLPAFYNKTSRGLKKAWQALQDSFTAETTMYEAMKILEQFNIRTHSYCMMD